MSPRVLCALLAAFACGCDVVPRAPVDLRAAQVVSVQVGAEAGHQTMCPGEAVPLDLDVTALLPGKSEPTRLHLHREELDDWLVDSRAFHMSSRQGKVDDEAVFHPSPDVRSSAETGFLVDVHMPNGPVFGVRFRPMYDCVRAIGVTAPSGRDGAPGESGLSGYGVDGEVGAIGGAGGVGAAGLNETVYVTFVKTPFYSRLMAALSEGDHEELVLAPPDRSLIVEARGGAGGAGGEGGEGGHAFSTLEAWTKSRSRSRHPAPAQLPPRRPGDGGLGGPGGPGGPGGHVIVHLDSRYPELADRLQIDVRGGQGGRGGSPGKPGDTTPVYGYSQRGPDEPNHGRPGTPGAMGPGGTEGTKEVVLDDNVAARFAGMGGIQAL